MKGRSIWDKDAKIDTAAGIANGLMGIPLRYAQLSGTITLLLVGALVSFYWVIYFFAYLRRLYAIRTCIFGIKARDSLFIITILKWDIINER